MTAIQALPPGFQDHEDILGSMHAGTPSEGASSQTPLCGDDHGM
jgi:hypothetical protein